MGQVDISEFLQRGLCVLVGTRDNALQPLCVTGSAMFLSAPGRAVVFLPAFESAPALANLGQNGQIAVVLEQPTTHRGIQIKGSVTGTRPPSMAEVARIEEFVSRTLADLSAIGFAPTVLNRMDFLPVTAVEFTFDAVFEQTPGPGAGRAVKASS